MPLDRYWNAFKALCDRPVIGTCLRILYYAAVGTVVTVMYFHAGFVPATYIYGTF